MCLCVCLYIRTSVCACVFLGDRLQWFSSTDIVSFASVPALSPYPHPPLPKAPVGRQGGLGGWAEPGLQRKLQGRVQGLEPMIP